MEIEGKGMEGADWERENEVECLEVKGKAKPNCEMDGLGREGKPREFGSGCFAFALRHWALARFPRKPGAS